MKEIKNIVTLIIILEMLFISCAIICLIDGYWFGAVGFGMAIWFSWLYCMEGIEEEDNNNKNL